MIQEFFLRVQNYGNLSMLKIKKRRGQKVKEKGNGEEGKIKGREGERQEEISRPFKKESSCRLTDHKI